MAEPNPIEELTDEEAEILLKAIDRTLLVIRVLFWLVLIVMVLTIYMARISQ